MEDTTVAAHHHEPDVSQRHTRPWRQRRLRSDVGMVYLLGHGLLPRLPGQRPIRDRSTLHAVYEGDAGERQDDRDTRPQGERQEPLHPARAVERQALRPLLRHLHPATRRRHPRIPDGTQAQQTPLPSQGHQALQPD